MRPFSLPIWLKCGQRPTVILGVFTVFGWLAPSRRPKAGKSTRRQAGRRGSMGWPRALDSQPHSHSPYLFAGYPSGMPSKAFSLDIGQQQWPKRPETGTDIQAERIEIVFSRISGQGPEGIGMSRSSFHCGCRSSAGSVRFFAAAKNLELNSGRGAFGHT